MSIRTGIKSLPFFIVLLAGFNASAQNSTMWGDYDPLTTYQSLEKEIKIGHIFNCELHFVSSIQGKESITTGALSAEVFAGRGSFRLKKLDHRFDNTRFSNGANPIPKVHDNCHEQMTFRRDVKWGSQRAMLERCYFFDNHQVSGTYEGEIVRCVEDYRHGTIAQVTCILDENIMSSLFRFTPGHEFYHVEVPPMDDFDMKTNERRHEGVLQEINVDGGLCD